MTIEEILKSHELSDEQIDKIKADMKANKIFTVGEENLDVRYEKLKSNKENVSKQLDEANSLIEEMKKGAKDNESLQAKISEYKKAAEELEKEKDNIEKESALKIALLENGVEDVDYLAFKIKEMGEVELDDNGKVKNIDQTIETMKTQHPTQFKENAERKIDPKKLTKDEEENDAGISKDDIDKMDYKSVLQYKQDNPEKFEELKGE